MKSTLASAGVDLPNPEALEHLDVQPQPTGTTVANASGRRRAAESGSEQDAKLNFSMILVHTPAPSLLPSCTSFWLACLSCAPCLPAAYPSYMLHLPSNLLCCCASFTAGMPSSSLQPVLVLQHVCLAWVVLLSVARVPICSLLPGLPGQSN